MSDIRDWGKFIRGRWDWTSGGYEEGFPRGCQFTDVDGDIEFDGCRLELETKHWDGVGERPPLPLTGQLRKLQDAVSLGKSVLVLYGCGPCNDPRAVYDVGRNEWFDWTGLDKPGASQATEAPYRSGTAG